MLLDLACSSARPGSTGSVFQSKKKKRF